MTEIWGEPMKQTEITARPSTPLVRGYPGHKHTSGAHLKHHPPKIPKLITRVRFPSPAPIEFWSHVKRVLTGDVETKKPTLMVGFFCLEFGRRLLTENLAIHKGSPLCLARSVLTVCGIEEIQAFEAARL
jgi:hypothetical protein